MGRSSGWCNGKTALISGGELLANPTEQIPVFQVYDRKQWSYSSRLITIQSRTSANLYGRGMAYRWGNATILE